MKLFLFFSVLLTAVSAPAAEKYDRQMLSALGYDAAIADLLEAGAHFLPGQHPVSIVINGKSGGIHPVMFDDSGSPCWNATLLRRLEIDPGRFTSVKPGCLQPVKESGIRLVEQVERSMLLLHIPADALLRESQYATGGSALMANYDFRRYDVQTQSGKYHYSQTLTSELGANISQWILRSGQNYTAFNGESRLKSLYRYAQRSFPGRAAVMQAGEIITGDPLFSGMTLTGIQMLPEHAAGNLVSLTVALPQSGSAEVWQGNILLKTYQVSAGINRLGALPALNQQDDFTVVTVDRSGNRQRQTIPRIQVQPENALMESGPAFAAGRLRLNRNHAPLMLASTGLLQTPQIALTIGGLASERYQAAAWRARLRLAGKLSASLSQTFSQVNRRGVTHQAALNYPLDKQLSLTTSVNFRSRRYRAIDSGWGAESEDGGQIRAQFAAGASLNRSALGLISLNGSYTQNWQGHHTRSYTLAWSRTFARLNLNLGIQKNRLTTAHRHQDDRYAYLNFSLPLGRDRNLRGWVTRSDGQMRAGTSYDQSVSPAFAWSLSSEKSAQEAPSLASSASWTSKYSQLSGGIARSAASQRLSIAARGGAVWHSEGLTFTPREVGDTFSVISLRRAQPDVEIRTPAGAVWSDRSGHAVVSWTPWQKNSVQINPNSLPDNVQIPGGIVELTPFRGAVVPVELPAWRVRRVLLSFPAQERPEAGSAVENGSGSLIAFTGEDGTLFIDDLPAGTLYARRPGGARCAIVLTTPWVERPGSLYTPLFARCVT